MTIEPPEQRGKAVKRSRVSLARSDPLHPNFNCNLDLNEHNSGDDSTDDGAYNMPKYHRAGRGRKLQDWRIQATKPIMILGDSNLNRMPPFKNRNIQVDNYPGANFYHFIKLFGMTPACEKARLVLPSLGLNNKDQDP